MTERYELRFTISYDIVSISYWIFIELRGFESNCPHFDYVLLQIYRSCFLSVIFNCELARYKGI